MRKSNWVRICCLVLSLGSLIFCVDTAKSETPSDKVIERATSWLIEHQNEDGGWDFDHTAGRCQNRCTHPGQMKNARNSATAMALLAMLRAGETHRQGNYKEQMEKGVRFLTSRARADGNFSDAGTMYSHGLATLALCETYKRSQDDSLKATAQKAIDFIVRSQDPKGGGWRYVPRQPGDTSVTGWQVSALRVAKDAGLNVPQNCLDETKKFLQSVRAVDGEKYGYTAPGKGVSTTAIGLNCRVLLGTEPQEPSFVEGRTYLASVGPSNTNMYYNYYATPVIHAAGGEPWEQWKKTLQPSLAERQEKEGHAAGSWLIDNGDHGATVGGRVYCTTMALMYYCQLVEK